MQEDIGFLQRLKEEFMPEKTYNLLREAIKDESFSYDSLRNDFKKSLNELQKTSYKRYRFYQYFFFAYCGIKIPEYKINKKKHEHSKES